MVEGAAAGSAGPHRGDSVSGERWEGRGHGAPQRGSRSRVAALRRRIGDELGHAERVIAALTRDLDRYRRDNAALTRERDRLRERATALEVVRLARDDAEALWRTTVHEQRDLAAALRQLEEAHQELARRCADLQRALDGERARTQLAAQEIECLEQQVTELEAILRLVVPPDSAG